MAKTPTQSDIAQRLRHARQRLFKTASEAAEALDMKAVTLRAHENGQNGINLYDAERYARRYNVNLQWLLTGRGDDSPNPALHVELGEMIDVESEIDALAWIPDDDPTRARQKFRRPEVIEQVPFTDPRFPISMVEAFKVKEAAPDAHYISGSIIFCINSAETGFQDGDHVFVIRERGDFTNVSVRRVEQDAKGERIFRSLTHPDEPALTWQPNEKEALLHISAVVIGSLTRRPVRTVDIEGRKQHEEYRRSLRFTPKDWKAMIAEARAVVAGKISVEDSVWFGDMDTAEMYAGET